MKKLFVFFTPLLLLFAFMTQAAATVEPDMMSPEKAVLKTGLYGIVLQNVHFIYMHDQELGLSKEQQQKILNIQAGMKKAVIPKKAELEVVAIDLANELMKESVDLNAVNSMVERKQGIKGQIDKSAAAAAAEIKKVLTPDQHNKLLDLMMTGPKKGMKGDRMGGMTCPHCGMMMQKDGHEGCMRMKEKDMKMMKKDQDGRK